MSTPSWGIEKGGWRNGRPVAQVETRYGVVSVDKATIRLTVRLVGHLRSMGDVPIGMFVTSSGGLGFKTDHGVYNSFWASGEQVSPMDYIGMLAYPCSVD